MLNPNPSQELRLRGSEPGTWVTLKPGTWVTLLLCGTEVDRAVEGNDAHA
jgi:hypothetical protein